jgi:hypothetical protein
MRPLLSRTLFLVALGLAALPLPAAAVAPGVIARVAGSGPLGVIEWGGELIDTNHVVVGLRARVLADGSADGGVSVEFPAEAWPVTGAESVACRVNAGAVTGTDRVAFSGAGARLVDGAWEPLGPCLVDVWEHAYGNTNPDDRIVIEFTGAGITLEGRANKLRVTVSGT